MSDEKKQNAPTDNPLPPTPASAKPAEAPPPRLSVSVGPHITDAQSVPKIMYAVVLALLPAAFVSVYVFGLSALGLILICPAAAVATEWFVQKYMWRRTITAFDGSAVLTGLLLAYSIPASLPLYMGAIGSILAVFIAKQLFGGLGYNIFNPAMIGRAILLLSWPVHMTQWPTPTTGTPCGAVDAVTCATPLGVMKAALAQGQAAAADKLPMLGDMFLGLNRGGSLGEVSAAALLLGGLFLLWRKAITWHVPAAMLAAAALTSMAFQQSPSYHVLSGGLILGAFFIATDMVTMPLTGAGRLLFGAGCGVLAVLIRMKGGYPEGVCYAVLIMNAFVPLIDRGFKPRRFGLKTATGKAEGAKA
jgi:electron transport complex protein RnfD